MSHLQPVQFETKEEMLQCAVCGYLLNSPLQFPCGHRMCAPCVQNLKQQSAQTFFCKKCKETIEFMNYFHDKAAAKEIDYLSVSCPYGKCIWSGEYRHFQDHVKDECQMVEMPCPNNGCSELVQKINLDKHLKQCKYRIVNCQWCKQYITYDQWQNYVNKKEIAKVNPATQQVAIEFNASTSGASCHKGTTAAAYFMNTKPKMANLICSVFPKIKSRWKYVAYLMDYEIFDIDAFEKDAQNCTDCCLNLFTDWLSTDKGVKPKTWYVLIEQIKKVDGLQQAAADISNELDE